MSAIDTVHRHKEKVTFFIVHVGGNQGQGFWAILV